MKRLMMTALLLGNALAASASTVNWGAATATSVDNTKITTGTMYLLWADKGTHIDIASALTAGSPYDINAIMSATGLSKLDSFAYNRTSPSRRKRSIRRTSADRPASWGSPTTWTSTRS